jgi:hypothetical protein
VAELVFLGRLGFEDSKVVVLDASPTGSKPLDAVVRKIGSSPPRPTGDWVAKLFIAAGTKEVAKELIAAGVLKRESFWFTTPPRYVRTGPEAHAEVLGRLHAAVVQGGAASSRTVALASLVLALDLDEVVFPGVGRGWLEGRMRELSSGQWAAPHEQWAVSESTTAAAACRARAATIAD